MVKLAANPKSSRSKGKQPPAPKKQSNKARVPSKQQKVAEVQTKPKSLSKPAKSSSVSKTKPAKTVTVSKPSSVSKAKPSKTVTVSKTKPSKTVTVSKPSSVSEVTTDTVPSVISDLRSTLQKDLLAEKTDLEQRIAAIEIIPSESTGDFGDISSALSDEGLKIIERDRLLAQLEKVKKVLNRLTTDKYFANCDDCGDEIEYKRLIFIPTARRCVYCQQNAERK